MRFDDMIATVLAQPADRPDRRTAIWRQLVDLLAQRRPDPRRRRGRARLCPAARRPRGAIDPSLRRQAARALAGRAVDPDLLAFFAEDSAVDRGAADRRGAARPRGVARLAAPARAGGARAAAPPRGSRYRGEAGARRLRSQRFRARGRGRGGAGGGAARSAAGRRDQSESQIRELVARIEAYRQQKGSSSRSAVRAVLRRRRAEGFRWETGTDGILVWVEGAPRGPLVGQSIAWIAGPGHYGVDGQAAGGFDKRAPFRDARFSVAGERAGCGRLADFRHALLRFAARQLPRLSRHRTAAAARRGRAQPRRGAPVRACSAPNSRPIRCAS